MLSLTGVQVVTGTPIGRGGMADIHALLRSLRMDPLPSVLEPMFSHEQLEDSGKLSLCRFQWEGM